MQKTKFKTLFSLLAVALLAVCCFAFTACGGGNTLDQEATYDQNVEYSDTVSSEESQNVVNSLSEKYTINATTGQITNIDVLSAYRFTMVAKDAEGNVTSKINMAVKGNEMMAHMEASEEAGNANAYIKDNVIYFQGKSGGVDVKYKRAIPEAEIDASMSTYGLGSLFSTYVEALKTGLSGYTVKKSGNNYKFSYSKTIGTLTSSASIILQLDDQGNVKALHVEANTMGIVTEMTLSPFDGDLNFPDLGGYTEA